MRKLLLCCMVLFCCYQAQSNNTEDSLSTSNFLDSVNASFKYQTGVITIGDNIASLTTPPGYKYLDPKQSEYVLHNLWGNPPSSNLGMLIAENSSPMDSNVWVIEITYSEEGYIEDDDAKDLNYDDLLKDMQKDAEEGNAERIKQNYQPIKLVGWAAPPYYDDKSHKLHWAKEIKFGSDEVNTLNYNIRILGRKGYLTLNAIGSIGILPAVNKDIDKILASVEFKEGNKYADFNPSIDKIAAYGIGGLITGKILAKVGLFALMAKFWKIIAAGVVALFYFIKRKFMGGKEDTPALEASNNDDNTSGQS